MKKSFSTGKIASIILAFYAAFGTQNSNAAQSALVKPSQTVVSIRNDAFYINGKPTYQGVSWKGYKIEGLLMNSRMVQGIFDDKNDDRIERLTADERSISAECMRECLPE